MFKVACCAVLLWSDVVAADNLVTSNRKKVAFDCAKDPVVNVKGNANTVTVTGSCKEIEVTGDGNLLTVVSGATVTLDGNDNLVTIKGVDTISVTGDRNKVSYQHAVDSRKQPRIANRGEGNTITRK